MAVYKFNAILDKFYSKTDLASAAQTATGRSLKWFLGHMLEFYLNSNNIFYYVKLVSENPTNLKARNTQLSLDLSMYMAVIPIALIHGRWPTITSTAGPKPFQSTAVGLSGASGLVMASWGAYGNLTTRKDRCIFTGIVLASVPIMTVVRAIMAEVCPFPL